MRSVANQRGSDPVAPQRLHRALAGSAMFSERAWEAIARGLRLSGRQLQIVRGIFDDETDLGIAQQIGVSLHTVHTHVERLHHKLAITDRPQLVLRVMEEFLTLPNSSNRPPVGLREAESPRHAARPRGHDAKTGSEFPASCRR